MRVARFHERWDLFGALRGRAGVDVRECECSCRWCARAMERAA
jgi:hypothetical protein